LDQQEEYRHLSQETEPDNKSEQGVEEEPNFFTEKKMDVHDENRVLLFRHFVDALVRVAYLKYGGPPAFYKNVEKVLVKIRNSFNTKKKNKQGVEDEVITHEIF